MIVIKLMGGLGNQIFQWAFGKSLSQKFGMKFYLDLSSYNVQENITFRYFSLNKFPNLKYEIIDMEKHNIENFIIIKESEYNEDFKIDKNKNYYFDGYWQSENYFIEISEEIKKELQPNEIFLSKIEKFPYFDHKKVSIHIRRTDYLTSNGYHPVQPIEYYENALKLIKNFSHIYVFSDDIEWCKNNLEFENITFVESFDDVEDIWIMSFCDNNIIANSSFSWWGAWINKNIEKQVIAPKLWFGDSTKEKTNKIIPESWIQI